MSHEDEDECSNGITGDVAASDEQRLSYTHGIATTWTGKLTTLEGSMKFNSLMFWNKFMKVDQIVFIVSQSKQYEIISNVTKLIK